MKRIVALFVVVLAAGAARADEAKEGKQVYTQKCVMCHGADGKAKKMGSPDLSTLKASESEIEAVVTNGKGKMPKYAGKLTPDQIKDVSKYVKTLAK